MRRVVGVLVVLLLVATGLASPVGAIPPKDRTWYLYNDSPSYSFGSGSAPVRNAPSAVIALSGYTVGAGFEFDITDIVNFVPEGTTINGRIDLYSAPKRRPELHAGFEWQLWPPPGETAKGTLVERESAGTATSPEVWKPADEDFGSADIEYTADGAHVTIKAKGSYRKLLRDPLTTVGYDLWTGESGTNVQPSARVSIGDLTGKKPGLLPQYGTSVAADGSPQPWITLPVDMEFYGWKVRTSAKASDPEHVAINAGKYSKEAFEVRLFLAYQFKPLGAGAAFPAYQIVRFRPDDTSATLRLGDAFRSSDGQSFTVSKKGKSSFALEFSQQLTAGYANVQVVVAGQTDSVLLATGLQYKF